MISAIIITKNEEKMIGDCLRSLSFADEIIVVDTGNTDQTNAIAVSLGAKIIKYKGPMDYSAFRNTGISKAKGDWLLYVDADERITHQLSLEIIEVTKDPESLSAYAIPRQNMYLGKELKYGGWGGDYVIRLLKKKDLKSWENVLHEQPKFSGGLGKLQNKLLHISHRDLSSMLEKTLVFTRHEADLRLKAGHPQMSWWRFFRVMFTEFWTRFVRLSAWKDGAEGIIDGIFQVYNTFIIYARLWEMQNKNEHHS